MGYDEQYRPSRARRGIVKFSPFHHVVQTTILDCEGRVQAVNCGSLLEYHYDLAGPDAATTDAGARRRAESGRPVAATAMLRQCRYRQALLRRRAADGFFAIRRQNFAHHAVMR